jgi:hypothetical protein
VDGHPGIHASIRQIEIEYQEGILYNSCFIISIKEYNLSFFR